MTLALFIVGHNVSGGRNAGTMREADAFRLARYQEEERVRQAMATPAPVETKPIKLTLAGQRIARLVVGEGEGGWTLWVSHQGQSDGTIQPVPKVPMDVQGPINDGDGFQRYRFRAKDGSGLKEVIFTITEPR
jgi:hypothetical protein